MVDPSKNWIALNRALKICDMWLSEPFTRGQAWVDLLMLAQWKDGFIRRRGVKIPTKRGQVTEAQDTLAVRWKWSKGKVQRFLKELKEDERISNETVLKNCSVSALISITNYDLYQSNGTEDGPVNEPKTDPKTIPKTDLKTVPFKEVKEREEGKEEPLNPLSTEAADQRIPYEDIRMAYNKFCPSFSKALDMNPSRKNAIRLRWEHYKKHDGGPLHIFDTLFKKAEASDFISGRDGKWAGKRGIDWLLKDVNMVKVLEGNFDNKHNVGGKKGLSDDFKNSFLSGDN